jgi:single-strand selective monofunctional uracil DNA glycosylase
MGVAGVAGEPPAAERHPSRPVLGFAGTRREGSGRRLYGLAPLFGGFEGFFRRFWIVNYCPAAFFDAAGRNLTPPHLRRQDRDALFAVCDRHLARVVAALAPEIVIGVGRFAETRAAAVVNEAPGRARPGGRREVRPAGPPDLSAEQTPSPRERPAPPTRVAGILHPSPASPAANRGWQAHVLATLASLGIQP